ncbi:MAG: sigma-70 family RNA polymerase sigma factor [Cytophagales bacterium]|nr:sigma-70 family RNA polymerase sigma factor [Cytophagales bacterium]
MEILNDGFLKVFTRTDQYDPERSFKGWLRRIMINTALDHYRQEVKHYHHEDVEAAGAAPVAAPVIGDLAHEELIGMVQRLSPAYRLVFNLYVIDGFTHEEIAGQLGISAGTSKSNLARARVQLKEMVQNSSKDAYAGNAGQ